MYKLLYLKEAVYVISGLSDPRNPEELVFNIKQKAEKYIKDHIEIIEVEEYD